MRDLDWSQNPQAAADGPRWKITAGGEVLLEYVAGSEPRRDGQAAGF
jgi:hypothetical protein